MRKWFIIGEAEKGGAQILVGGQIGVNRRAADTEQAEKRGE
jgi:hypothetical protein